MLPGGQWTGQERMKTRGRRQLLAASGPLCVSFPLSRAVVGPQGECVVDDLVLEEELLGVQHGPAHILKRQTSVLAVGDVLLGRGHLGRSRVAGQCGHVE